MDKKTINVMRTIAILAVLLHHSLSNVNSTTLSILVGKVAATSNTVLFLYISGYLYSVNREKYIRGGRKSFIFNKTIRLYLPYLIWTFLMQFVFYILYSIQRIASMLHNYRIPRKSITDIIVDTVLFQNMPSEHLWYLYSLFIIFLFLALLKFPKINAISALIAVAFVLLIKINFPLPVLLDHIITSLPVFLFGSSNEFLLIKDGLRTKRKWIYVFLYLIVFFEYGYIHLVPDAIRFLEYYLLTFLLIRVVQIIALISSDNKSADKAFEFISEHSFAIYLMHDPYIVIPISLIASKLHLNWLLSVCICYISVMPTNLYGPNDNYHPEHSHVLPALIRRFHEAKVEGKTSVTCWGDGSPLREFLYVDDLANLCVFLMNNYSGNETVNAGTGKELTIKELTELVAKVVGYEGAIEWDTSKPNGTPRKLLDVSKATKLGWTYKTELEDGIRLAYEDFLNNPMRAER